MPFEQPIAKIFTLDVVRGQAPPSAGVYGITNSSEWIYIGETANIRESLIRHLEERNGELKKRVPTGFVFEACGDGQRRARQDRLVQEYEPVCNRHWSRHK